MPGRSFSEDWLILSKIKLLKIESIPHAFFKVSFIDQTGRFSGRWPGCLPCVA
jgi:hypothetical protein